MFHEIMYNEENDCFSEVSVEFPFQFRIVNLKLVRNLEILEEFIPDEYESDEESDEKERKDEYGRILVNWNKLDRVERMTIPLQDDFYFLPILEQYFTKLRYLNYGFIFNNQVWNVVKKMPNLEVLQVVDFSDDLNNLDELEFGKDRLALGELNVIENFVYSSSGYSKQNVFNSLEIILSCCTKFGRITFGPDAFYVNITQLYKMVTTYSKQLESVTISIVEDNEVRQEVDQYLVQKVEFDCSFLKLRALNKTFATVLKCLFPKCKVRRFKEPNFDFASSLLRDFPMLEGIIKPSQIDIEFLKSSKILKNSSDFNELELLLSTETDAFDEE